MSFTKIDAKTENRRLEMKKTDEDGLREGASIISINRGQA